VLAYERGEGAERLGVFLNLTSEWAEVGLPEDYRGGELLLSATGQGADVSGKLLELGPDEGLIVRVPS
jgi:hypothetical protein